jgi:hypothetical protein
VTLDPEAHEANEADLLDSAQTIPASADDERR